MDRKEYQREYREKHREQLRENVKQWTLKNPEKVKGYKKKNYSDAILSGKHRYWKMHRGAKRIGIACSWGRDDFLSWYSEQNKVCFYCHTELTYGRELTGVSLDRLDNARGYERGNVVLSCRRCNAMKGFWLTSEQMIDAAKRYFTI